MQSLRETLLCHYRYDALDRLIANERPSAPERQRFYCKNRLATEIQGAIGHSIVQHDDQLLAQQQSEGDALDTTLLATDQQRSVLHTLKANNQRHPIAYSPYGHRPAENGLLSLLGFNGERSDPVTGHYLLGNGYRAFNPVLMRFNSPDSWSPFGKGGLNPYMYCLGDPISREDANGHISFPMAVKLAVFVNRLKSNSAATRQLNKLATLSKQTSVALPLNALEKLQIAKNNSISLKRIALKKVENLGAITPEVRQHQAFKDAKIAVTKLDAEFLAARQQYTNKYANTEYTHHRISLREGLAPLENIIEPRNGGVTGQLPLPPLSPTSTKMLFANMDKIIKVATDKIRRQP